MFNKLITIMLPFMPKKLVWIFSKKYIAGETIEDAIRVCKELNRRWKIRCLPGAELTHVPIEDIPRLVKQARKLGAKIIVGHGESPVEPVIKGTNKAFIIAKVDILAHPGLIENDDSILARHNNVYLEITTRKGHSKGNKHVIKTCVRNRTPMILNNDSHVPDDLLSRSRRLRYIEQYGLTHDNIYQVLENSVKILNSK